MLASCEAPVDLNEVSTFVKVVEAGGFTAAAEELELPKSTISRRIARLEERLGVRLLERTTRKMRLTEAGQAYFDQVAVAIATLHSASSAAEEQQDSPRGLLKLTAPVDPARVSRRRLGALHEALPGGARQVELTGRVVDLTRRGPTSRFVRGSFKTRRSSRGASAAPTSGSTRARSTSRSAGRRRHPSSFVRTTS
ncbi:MAG: LysR family transcriptional regulator [Polyangiales bacterium]